MLQDFFTSATLFDIVFVLVAMGFFVAGWLQGTIRQLLGIGGFLAAFLLAANLRDPLGDFLARNWTFNDRTFDFMLALLGLWIAWTITFQIAIQSFYRRVVLHARLVFLDEVIGGFLGAFQVILVVSLLTIVFDSYYASATFPAAPHDADWARALEALLKDSAIVGALRDGFIPILLGLFGPLLPADFATPVS